MGRTCEWVYDSDLGPRFPRGGGPHPVQREGALWWRCHALRRLPPTSAAAPRRRGYTTGTGQVLRGWHGCSTRRAWADPGTAACPLVGEWWRLAARPAVQYEDQNQDDDHRSAPQDSPVLKELHGHLRCRSRCRYILTDSRCPRKKNPAGVGLVFSGASGVGTAVPLRAPGPPLSRSPARQVGSHGESGTRADPGAALRIRLLCAAVTCKGTWAGRREASRPAHLGRSWHCLSQPRLAHSVHRILLFRKAGTLINQRA